MNVLKRFLISFMLMLTCTILYAQTEITGTVVDETGETVIGATVMEKGTTNGTVTDFDGVFTIKVNPGATLVFSYVGFLNVEMPASNGMVVTMKEDALALNEIVVTGYTTQRKADLTGAVSVVSVTDLVKQNENNPIKAMQGRVPGMNISADGNPSGAATVRIRGTGTLNNNDPLYIIDGVPTKAGMHELNGNDIESIQVLKDAASASIYGSRAANGVIIITTKGGKDGKVKIDFDASLSVQTYAHKMKVLNAKEFGQTMWQGYVNDGLNPNLNGLGYHYDWSYDANGVPMLNNITMSKFLDPAGKTPAADTDWFKETTRTGLVQQYNLSLSQGTENGTSFFSLGYYKNDGIIKKSDFQRLSARMNSTYKLLPVGDRKIVTVGEHFTVNRTNELQAPGGFLENVLQFNPSLPVYTTVPWAVIPTARTPWPVWTATATTATPTGACSVMLSSTSTPSPISTSSRPSVLTIHRNNSASSPIPSPRAPWPIRPMPLRPSRSTGPSGCGTPSLPTTWSAATTVVTSWSVPSSTARTTHGSAARPTTLPS